MSGESTVWLFSYGTLQDPKIQQATFGRTLEGRPDALAGHALVPVPIPDPVRKAAAGVDCHYDARPTRNPADEVAGVVFRITEAELAAADVYEAYHLYRRRTVRLKSGLEAIVYEFAG